MTETFYGYCPTQDKDYCISVSYLDASDLSNTKYIRGLLTCDYASYGGNCSINCPILTQAPEEICR